MTLRIMLVGLVASMGFELPSGPQVSCWTRSGRDWVHARLADRSGPDAEPTDCRQAETSGSIETPVLADVATTIDDTAFDALSEAMVAGFAADSLTMRGDQSPSEDDPVTLVSEALLAVGLPDGEELADPAELVGETDPATVAESDLSDEETTGTDEPGSRADRVSSAIRLTQEAVRAWADLIQESADADESCPAR